MWQISAVKNGKTIERVKLPIKIGKNALKLVYWW
jgi:hypothetical protein